jgi:hypothetical protein
MRGTVLHRLPKERLPKPLVVRAGLGRTFGSLTGFLALLFLSWGISSQMLSLIRLTHKLPLCLWRHLLFLLRCYCFSIYLSRGESSE